MTSQTNKFKMNKKGQFLARDWLMALILFTGVVALATLMVTSQATSYGNTDIIDPDILEDFGNLQDATAIAGDAFDATNQKGSLGIVSAGGVLFASSFSVISLVFNSVSIATSQLTSFGEFIGMPTEVSQIFFPILIGLLTIVLVFIVISTTTRREI